MKTERFAMAYRLILRLRLLSVRSLSKIAHIYRLIVTGSLAIVTLCSVTASFMTCYLRRKTTEAPAISTRPGFLRTAHGQSGDEASAGHSLAVARTRYIKGRQALRNKYDYQ